MTDSADCRWQPSWPIGAHLSEESLLELHALRSAGETRQAARYLSHVRACDRCRHAFTEMEAAWTDIFSAAHVSADHDVSADRLERQVNGVLRRIDSEPGRVLLFPAPPPPARPRPTSHRWIAMAAASGLVFGLAAGRLLDPTPGAGSARVAAGWSGAPASVPPAATAPPARVQDDEHLLVEIDAALAQNRAVAFRVLDDLTPRTVTEERRPR